MLIVNFGQHVLWSLPRKKSDTGKLDSERNYWMLLGLGGTSSEAYIGTANGVEKAHDFRLADDSPYCMDDPLNFHTSIREDVEGSPGDDTIVFQETELTVAEAIEPVVARRMRLNPGDL